MAKVKLHRCPFTFVHNNLDHCWKVQEALDDQGIDYEVIKVAIYPRGRRKEVIRLSGQHMVPVIEFEDGSSYRAESAEMAETIKSGRLFEQSGSDTAAP